MSTIDVSDLRSTIVPKSDQLNAEQLLTGPITVTVTDVRVGSSDEQPITVHYENENGRPFRPCKTMRKVLVLAWGEDGRTWAGKSMTLYQDPSVKFGGLEVGGIRISHMTDIKADIRVSLTATKGKKALYEVKRMVAPTPAVARPALDEKHAAMVAEFEQIACEYGFEAFKAAWGKTPQVDRAAIGTAERDRIGAIGTKHDQEQAKA